MNTGGILSTVYIYIYMPLQSNKYRLGQAWCFGFEMYLIGHNCRHSNGINSALGHYQPGRQLGATSEVNILESYWILWGFEVIHRLDCSNDLIAFSLSSDVMLKFPFRTRL
jgi:hypothetical protein